MKSRPFSLHFITEGNLEHFINGFFDWDCIYYFRQVSSAVIWKFLSVKKKQNICFFFKVNFSTNDPGYLMFIPSRIADNRRLILQLLNVTCGREDLSASIQDLGTLKEDGYLLMVCCQGGQGSVKDCPCWFGQIVKVDPTAETAIALSHIQVPIYSQLLCKIFRYLYHNVQ